MHGLYLFCLLSKPDYNMTIKIQSSRDRFSLKTCLDREACKLSSVYSDIGIQGFGSVKVQTTFYITTASKILIINRNYSLHCKLYFVLKLIQMIQICQVKCDGTKSLDIIHSTIFITRFLKYFYPLLHN